MKIPICCVPKSLDVRLSPFWRHTISENQPLLLFWRRVRCPWINQRSSQTGQAITPHLYSRRLYCHFPAYYGLFMWKTGTKTRPQKTDIQGVRLIGIPCHPVNLVSKFPPRNCDSGRRRFPSANLPGEIIFQLMPCTLQMSRAAVGGGRGVTSAAKNTLESSPFHCHASMHPQRCTMHGSERP